MTTTTTKNPNKEANKKPNATNQLTKQKNLNLRKENNSVLAKGISDRARRKTTHEESCFKKQGY